MTKLEKRYLEFLLAKNTYVDIGTPALIRVTESLFLKLNGQCVELNVGHNKAPIMVRICELNNVKGRVSEIRVEYMDNRDLPLNSIYLERGGHRPMIYWGDR